MKKISIIIPFFNEDEGVQHFFTELNAELIKIKEYSFELVLVDDGSVELVSTHTNTFGKNHACK